MKFPPVIYINQTEENDFLAWDKLESSDNGKVGIYALTEVVDKRETVEVKRAGTKKWFRP